jgi:hypothetical protein
VKCEERPFSAMKRTFFSQFLYCQKYCVPVKGPVLSHFCVSYIEKEKKSGSVKGHFPGPVSYVIPCPTYVGSEHGGSVALNLMELQNVTLELNALKPRD